MIKIYTTPSCSSCRKAKKWMNDLHLDYKEVNLLVQELSEDELKYMLTRTENGAEDIVSKRSKVIKDGNVDIEDMSVSELIEFLREHPSALRRPIIIDERRFQVGYNDDEIRAFIPKEIRELSCYDCEYSGVQIKE